MIPRPGVPAGGFQSDVVAVVRTPLFQFIAATAVGTLILFARAPAAAVSPVLFAEDWHWTSMVMTRGFWDTALHARDDYHILGNVALIWGAIQLAERVVGDVFAIPQCLAMVSYAFFAATAALPLLLLRRQLPAAYRWAAWLLVCLMPLGIHAPPYWSGFEILGRAVNAGFAFLFIAFVLLWYRASAVHTFAQAVPVDLALLACTATNPLCIPMLTAATWPAARRWLVDRVPAARLVREGAFVSLCLLAVACVALNGLPASRPPHVIEPAPPVSPAAAVEIGVARGLLYPLVWPFYRRLSEWSTLAVAAGALAVTIRWGQPRHRPLVAAGLATVGLVSVVLVLRRGELAAHLDGYRSTFPDRYFLGQNLVATLMVVVFAADVAERLRGCGRRAWLPMACLLGLATAAAVHEPPWRIAPSQFLVSADDAVEITAIRSCRARWFVDATCARHPEGRFVAISVPRLSAAPLLLPRDSVERSLARRGERRRLLAARPSSPRL